MVVSQNCFFFCSSLQTVSKLVTAAGSSLAPFLARLVPALVAAAGDLESAKLSYLSTALTDSGTREILDDMRASATRQHYTTDTVVKVSLYYLFFNKNILILYLKYTLPYKFKGNKIIKFYIRKYDKMTFYCRLFCLEFFLSEIPSYLCRWIIVIFTNYIYLPLCRMLWYHLRQWSPTIEQSP